MNYRVLCPPSGPLQTCVVNGRTYVGVVGTPQDVPDFDYLALVRNGWIVLGIVGATSARPTPPPPGVYSYVDTTLSKVIFWDGVTWRDLTGASV